MADYSDDLVFDDIPSAIKAFGKPTNLSTLGRLSNTFLSQAPVTLFSSSTVPTAKMKATSSSLPRPSLPQKPHS
jgi:hypothetical protein